MNAVEALEVGLSQVVGYFFLQADWWPHYQISILID